MWLRIPGELVINFNAWAIEWGSAYSNPRGECLLDAFATLEIVLLNRGHKDTFTRNRRCSKIDLTFVSDSLANSSAWMLSDIYTDSDYQAIIFEFR